MTFSTTYTLAPPPPSPLINACIYLMGLGWVLCYVGQILHSVTHATYSMPFFAQASNLAWDFVYAGLIYPSPLAVERFVFLSGFAANPILQFAVIWYGRREWGHAPLVARNLGTLHAISIVVFVAGDIAVAKQLGPHHAGYYVATVARFIVSVGSLAQLLTRGATRGFSLRLCTVRHLGTVFAAPCFYLRTVYWPEAFGFLLSPIMLWMGVTSYFADAAYGVLFWWIQKQEERREKAR
ncbi:hypothetical protein BJX64DRAFT_283313 [Aspergillus heterothallicus]